MLDLAVRVYCPYLAIVNVLEDSSNISNSNPKRHPEIDGVILTRILRFTDETREVCFINYYWLKVSIKFRFHMMEYSTINQNMYKF